MEESKEQCAARGGQLAVGRSRPSSCRNPQPTVASHEYQEAQCHEQLGATTRACPLERNPAQRLKMVMPASARSNWKAHLGATFWRTLDGKNPNGWFPEQKLPVAETIEAYTIGVGLCRIRGARKRFDHDWEIGRHGSDQQKTHSRSSRKKSATFEF
jgi:hypothetical protein